MHLHVLGHPAAPVGREKSQRAPRVHGRRVDTEAAVPDVRRAERMSRRGLGGVATSGWAENPHQARPRVKNEYMTVRRHKNSYDSIASDPQATRGTSTSSRGARRAPARPAEPEITARAPRRKIIFDQGPRGCRALVASAPGGRGVRLDGVERFGARQPQRARRQAKFEGGRRTGAAMRLRGAHIFS